VESIFPTLKRGANKLCASGAFAGHSFAILNNAHSYCGTGKFVRFENFCHNVRG
jgi:hypothetical protein